MLRTTASQVECPLFRFSLTNHDPGLGRRSAGNRQKPGAGGANPTAFNSASRLFVARGAADRGFDGPKMSPPATSWVVSISAGCRNVGKKHRFSRLRNLPMMCGKNENLGSFEASKIANIFLFWRRAAADDDDDDDDGGDDNDDDIPCFQGKYLEILRRLFVSGCPVFRCFPVSVCRPNPRGKGRNRKWEVSPSEAVIGSVHMKTWNSRPPFWLFV